MGETITWVAFIFALVGRISDVVSTWMVTPKLLLEGNWLVRKFGWAYAWLSVSLALFAFVSPSGGIIIGTVSCLMAFSNMSFALISKYATGEQRIKELLATAIRNCSLDSYIIIFAVQFGPILALAFLIFSLAGYSLDNQISDIGYGIVFWVIMVAVFKLKVLRFVGKNKSGSAGSR